jgi:hypothetical protein
MDSGASVAHLVVVCLGRTYVGAYQIILPSCDYRCLLIIAFIYSVFPTSGMQKKFQATLASQKGLPHRMILEL